MKETTKEALLAIVDRMERPGPKDQHSADHDMAVEIDWLIDEGYLWTSANPDIARKSTVWPRDRL